jgi:hypothetical protein
MYLRELFARQLLSEGGNVFKTKDGTPMTQRINQADVPTTVKWLEKITGLDLTGEKIDKGGVPIHWLGSTGRKPTSGDLDLVVLTSDATKEQVAAKLSAWARSQGISDADIFNKGKDKNDGWIKMAGEVHFRAPIAGNPKNGFVQADFNFFPSAELRDWATFYMAGTSEKFRGMYRNVLLSSLAKAQGLKVGANGMFDRATNQPVKNGLDPDYVARVILNKKATRSDLETVESIFKALEKDPRRDVKLADFVGYAEREGLTLP